MVWLVTLVQLCLCTKKIPSNVLCSSASILAACLSFSYVCKGAKLSSSEACFFNHDLHALTNNLKKSRVLIHYA